MCGNKIDLERERVISTQEGKALATKWNCAFLESSALTKVNVDEMFINVTRQFLKSAQNEEKKKKKKCIIF